MGSFCPPFASLQSRAFVTARIRVSKVSCAVFVRIFIDKKLVALFAVCRDRFMTFVFALLDSKVMYCKVIARKDLSNAPDRQYFCEQEMTVGSELKL